MSVLVQARSSIPKSERHPFYENSKYITELTASTFSDFVHSSNYTTLVEFYAPWCGYCKQLRPEFEKASKEAHHYAQFAAVNCDLDENKQFCSQQGVKGFPTLLTYRPPKKFSEKKRRSQQYAVNTYENERSARGIANAMKGHIRAYTKKVPIDKLEKFFESHKVSSPSTKVLFISDNNQVSPMYKSLTVDYLGSLEFFHTLTKDFKYLETISKYVPELEDVSEGPILLVLDPESDTISLYQGEMKKNQISKFLTNFAIPSEGEFSERHEIIQGIKNGTYKSFKDYRKKKAKAAKANKDNLEKDEL